MSGRALSRLRRSDLPRDGLTAGLSVASVLTSPVVLRSVSSVLDTLDTGVALLLFYQTLAGTRVLGLQLSWVFIGYLVYAYTAEFYLGYFDAFADDPAFKLLTAAGSVYYGIVWSRAMGVVPDAGVFALLPTGGGLLGPIVGGLFVGLVAFGGYLLGWRRERLTDLEGDVFEVYETFTLTDQRSVYERISALPDWARRLVVGVNEALSAALFVVPCILLGLALAVVNAFYPVPEALVFLGVVLGAVPIGDRVRDRLPDAVGLNLEFRVADMITDAFRNFKGMVLAIYAGIGLALCGMAFVLGLGVLVSGVDALLSLGLGRIGTVLEVRPVDGLRVIATLWLVLGVIALPFAYAVAGLEYWFRQFARLPAYAAYWEARKRGRRRDVPSASRSRPAWLFLPGNALLVLLGALLWAAPGGTPSLPVLVGFDLAWPVAIAVVYWAARIAPTAPQPLAGEGRAVVLALSGQFLTLAGLGALVTGTSGVGGIAGVAAILVVLLGMTYFPEVTLFAERAVGAMAYTDIAYTAGIVLVLLGLFETVTAAPAVLYPAFVVLFALWTLFTYLEQRAVE